MAYPTKPAYIVICQGWEPRLREHPVFDWMFDHEEAFDFGSAKSDPYTTWATEDFKYTDAAGKSFQGKDAWDALLTNYAPLASHFHEPFFGVVFENEQHNYELFGCAKIFANLHVPGDGAKKKDLQGREWDVQFPGAFHFTYAKDATGPKGMKLSEQKLYADPAPLLGKLLERKMVTPEDLLQKLSA